MTSYSTITTIATIPVSRNKIIAFNGTIQPLKQMGSPYHRPGHTGSEINLMGKQAPISEINFVELFTSHALLIVAKAFYADLKYSYITLVQNTGESHTPLLVHGVSFTEKAGYAHYDDTDHTWALFITMNVEQQ